MHEGRKVMGLAPFFCMDQDRRNEKVLMGVGVGGWGGLPIKKYCRPPWLGDVDNFSFQIV